MDRRSNCDCRAALLAALVCVVLLFVGVDANESNASRLLDPGLLRTCADDALAAGVYGTAVGCLRELGDLSSATDMANLAVAYSRLGNYMDAILALHRASTVSRPWSQADMVVSSNMYIALASGPVLDDTMLHRVLSSPLLDHSLCFSAVSAAYAHFAVQRMAYWQRLPIDELVEACLSLIVSFASAGRHTEMVAHNSPQLWTSTPTYERSSDIPFLPTQTLEWLFQLYGDMMPKLVREAAHAYEMAYSPVHPSFRWLLSTAFAPPIEAALIAAHAPQWYRSLPLKDDRQKTQSVRLPPMRLAVMSSDLRRHSMGWLIHGLFHSLDRVIVTTTAYQVGSVGSRNTYGAEFQLANAYTPDEDWSMWTAHRGFDLSASPEARSLASGSLADSICDSRLWGHSSRLAAALDTFYAPGTWRTPPGFCAAMMPALCPHVDDHDDAAADILHEMATVSRPHILLDLNGQTIGKFPAILHARPAPVVVHAFSGSETTADVTGADWTLVDAYVMPPDLATWPSLFRQQDRRLSTAWCTTVTRSRRFGGKCAPHVFTEALAFIEAPYVGYTYASLSSMCEGSASAQPHGRSHSLSTCHALSTSASCASELGWCGTQRRTILLAFHSVFKILPASWLGWLNMMRHRPDTVLWLLASDPLIKARLRAQAAAHGLHTSRIVFLPSAPRELHLRRMLCGTLFLDTWQYGAHSSAADALRVGRPVLSLAGHNFASRIAGSLQHSWLLHDGASLCAGVLTTATSAVQLEQMFLHLCSQVPTPTVHRHHRHWRLSFLTARMWASASGMQGASGRSNRLASPFDHVTMARNIERALRVMWDARRAAQSTGPGYDIVNDGWDGTSWDIGRTRRDFHVIVGTRPQPAVQSSRVS